MAFKKCVLSEQLRHSAWRVLLLAAMGCSVEESSAVGETRQALGSFRRPPFKGEVLARGVGGFAISGTSSAVLGGQLSYRASAGDVNGDGLSDVLLLARRSAFVVFGKSDPDSLLVDDLAQTAQGFAIVPSATSSIPELFAIASAGDVNGDGLGDIVVGVPDTPEGGRGYVVFGKAEAEDVVLEDVAAGVGGFVITGSAPPAALGATVSGADVNGDGFSDVLLGAWGDYAPGNLGKAFVVWGSATPTAVDIADVQAGVGGFAVETVRQENFARVVSGAGDLNGDGLEDILVGAAASHSQEIGEYAGRVYVVLGKTTTETVEADAIASGEGGFTIEAEQEWDFLGLNGSGAGDVNGDGLDDAVFGMWASNHRGTLLGGRAGYVVFGKQDTEAVYLAEVSAGSGGFAIQGYEHNLAGYSVAGGADMNGDGFDDVMLGAVNAGPMGAGRAHVVFGKADTQPVRLVDVTWGDGGITIVGEEPYAALGYGVALAEDLNGDGFGDAVAGSPQFGGCCYAGRAYVVLGKEF